MQVLLILCILRMLILLPGPVAKIRLLGDWQHATRIAFVEFVKADSAKTALSCSGALLGELRFHMLPRHVIYRPSLIVTDMQAVWHGVGSLPVRVSPSKTPVRDDPTLHDKQPSPTAAEQ